MSSALSTHLALVNNTLSVLKINMSLLQSQIKTMEKAVKKAETFATKMQKKEKCVSSARKPSGFATPSKVSSELCEFLNKMEGTEMARTEVTKSMVAYIKGNCLHPDSEKKNVITPDDKLKSLLGISDEEKLTYFNLQRYMNKHFIKPDALAQAQVQS